MTRRPRGMGGPRFARHAFIWPALIVVLFLAIFPLIGSLFLSLSRVNLRAGGFEIEFIGITNFRNLLVGSQATHTLGFQQTPTPLGWVVIIGVAALLGWLLWRYARSEASGGVGLIMRTLGALLLFAFTWLAVHTILSEGGRPGTLMVTFIYALAGTALTYVLGLGLAVLTSQRLAGERFFRVVFLLPLMITPVGVAYMFRMLIDTQRGPFQPVWSALGMSDFAPLSDPWGARAAIIIGDTWQWTPFMFIVLLAALEGRDMEVEEAGTVDGAKRWQILRYITLPALIPVSATVILIRMIEAFKIVDLPNVIAFGGPGTATESLTLQSFFDWRAFNLGQSSAVAYTLLVIVTLVGVAYAATIVRRAQGNT